MLWRKRAGAIDAEFSFDGPIAAFVRGVSEERECEERSETFALKKILLTVGRIPRCTRMCNKRSEIFKLDTPSSGSPKAKFGL